MLRILAIPLIAGAALTGCTPPQMSYAEAMEFCHEKADAAAGPQGHVGLSIGTGGPSASLSLSLSDSYLRGDDPAVVYETCMNNLFANGQISGASE